MVSSPSIKKNVLKRKPSVTQPPKPKEKLHVPKFESKSFQEDLLLTKRFEFPGSVVVLWLIDKKRNHQISIDTKISDVAEYGSFSYLFHNDYMFCGCTDWWEEYPSVFMVTRPNKE